MQVVLNDNHAVYLKVAPGSRGLHDFQVCLALLLFRHLSSRKF